MMAIRKVETMMIWWFLLMIRMTVDDFDSDDDDHSDVDEYDIDNNKMTIIIMFYLLLDMLMVLYNHDSYGYDDDSYGYDDIMIVFI